MLKRKQQKTGNSDTSSKIEEIDKDKLTITLNNATKKSYGNFEFYINFELENNFDIANVDDIIGETITGLLLQDNNYSKNIEFIDGSILDYFNNNKEEGSMLNKIKEVFNVNMENINKLKGNIKEFSARDTEALYKDIFSVKNSNNDKFINGSYISIVGVESSKKQREDKGIGVIVDPSKISEGKLPSNFDSQIEIYKTYILDYLIYMYLLQKEVYDKYIYYITKIVEIHEQIENINVYVWEEEYLVNELIHIYNNDLVEQIKKYKVSVGKEKGRIINEINRFVEQLEQEISKNERNIINIEKINKITENLKRIKADLNSGTLTGDYEILVGKQQSQPSAVASSTSGQQFSSAVASQPAQPFSSTVASAQPFSSAVASQPAQPFSFARPLAQPFSSTDASQPAQPFSSTVALAQPSATTPASTKKPSATTPASTKKPVARAPAKKPVARTSDFPSSFVKGVSDVSSNVAKALAINSWLGSGGSPPQRKRTPVKRR